MPALTNLLADIPAITSPLHTVNIISSGSEFN
jgi:hypothetical protein